MKKGHESKSETKYSFDKLLEVYIGSGGRWQYLTFLIINIPICVPMLIFSVFAQITPAHRCLIPLLEKSNFSNANLTYSQVTELAIPMKLDPNLPPVIGQAYQPCQRYPMGWLVDALRLTNGSFEALFEFRNALSNDTLNNTEACSDGYAYDTALKEHQGTVIQDFDLVCDRAYWDPLSTTIYLLGKLVVLGISGYIADKYGRRKIILVAMFVAAIFGFGNSFSPNVGCYIGFRTVISFCDGIMYAQAYIYFMELTNSFHRNIFSMLAAVIFSIGSFTIYTILSLLLPTWRWVHSALSCGYLTVFLLIWWLLENPRWLIATGHEEEAFKVIKYIAKFNKGSDEKLPLTDEELKDAIHEAVMAGKIKVKEATQKRSLLETIRAGINGVLILFRTRRLRLRTVASSIFWFHIALDYYMMSFGITKMAGNAYLNFWLICVSTSVPAIALQYVLSWKVGRKWPLLVLSYLLVPIFLGVGIYQIFQTENVYNIWLMVSLSLGKIMIETSFNMVYMYTLELYPTDVCSFGFGMCSTVARIGSGLAPFVVHLGTSTWRPIPMLLSALISLIAATATFFLPETNKRPIPATVEEMASSKDEPIFQDCLCCKKINKEEEDVEVELDALI